MKLKYGITAVTYTATTDFAISVILSFNCSNNGLTEILLRGLWLKNFQNSGLRFLIRNKTKPA